MDVIVVLPNTTSETSGVLNSMGPGGTVRILSCSYVLCYKLIIGLVVSIFLRGRFTQ